MIDPEKEHDLASETFRHLGILITAVCLLCLIGSQAKASHTMSGQSELSLHSDPIEEIDSLNREATDSIVRIQEVSDSLVDENHKKSNITRKITPVDIDDNKPVTVLHFYDKHGNALQEPIMFLATLDTVTKPKSKPVYPLYNGLSIGVNFGDAIFMLAGQKHASFDIHADVSLHNWFFPTVEAGIGFANTTPENNNYTYKTRPSLYVKAGINYNFLYKSKPDYQFFLGLRAGYSHFSYSLTGVTINSGYWGESQNLQLDNLQASAFYGEALAGLKVKIAGNFSLGWSARYHFKFKVSSRSASTPWFIPGFGAGSPFSFTLSAYWTIPAKGNSLSEEETQQKH